jgi:branched-chain amino acid transport system substrate-binding protein
MKRSNFVALFGGGIAAGLVSATLVAAWAEPCPTQCASGKVPLGIALPMSGPEAGFGRQAAKAIEIGIRELNAAGGLMGIPVELVVGDDRCDAGVAIRVAKRLVEQDKINFLIGPICPAVAMEASPIYAKAGVIQFAPTVTSVELTRRNPDNIFRMVATDEQEARALATYLARQPKGTKLAVLYSDFFFRRAMMQLVRQALPAEVKAAARFEPLLDVPGTYDRVADKLQRDPPDVIYLALDADRVVELFGGLRKRGVKSRLIGGQHLFSQSLYLKVREAAEGTHAREAAEGIHAIAPIGPLDDTEFRKADGLLTQAGVILDLVALNSYAAVQTWAEAVRRAGGGEPKKVIEALRSGEFKTAVGHVAYDQRGDRRAIHYSLLTWWSSPRKVVRPEVCL